MQKLMGLFFEMSTQQHNTRDGIDIYLVVRKPNLALLLLSLLSCYRKIPFEMSQSESEV